MLIQSVTNEEETIRLEIHHDEHADSPRDWDNLGTIVGWHGRYTIGDEQPTDEPNQWLHEWRRGRKEKTFVMLPVFMYDHSGVALSTSGFSCPWDSGQVGYIYVTREDAEAKGWTWDRDRITEVLTQEIAIYSQYLNGEVYGFNVVRKQECGHWEDEDSCFGFFGSEWTENGMADHMADDVRPLLEEL